MSLEKSKVLVSFGLHVKHIRKAKSMTQVDVSAAMNRDQQSLQRVESGRVNPSLLYLIDLSRALDVSLEDLLSF